MSTKARKDTSGPLGVIDCLAAGFEILGQHLWLVALPVLLDLLLWLEPRLSIVPLLQGLAALLTSQPAPDPTTAQQVAQATQLLEQFGERFNLLSLLSALPLFNVPSLLARHAPAAVSPLGEPQVLLVTNVLGLMVWIAGLTLAGLVLGFLYLNSVAHRVRATHSHTPTPPHHHTPTPSPGVGKFIRVSLFVAGLLVTGIVLASFWLLLAAAAAVIAPLFGLLVWTLGVGLGGYVGLHLLFVVHGILLGERGLLQAAWESIVLIHTQLPSVMGLVVLAVVTYEGLGFVWSLPSGDSWSLLIGILGNGCTATALTTATFVFYQERAAVSGS